MSRIPAVRLSLLLISFQLLSFPILAPAAFAGAQGDPQKCDGSTADMVECLRAQTAEWDKRMTVAYEKAMKEASPQQHDQLRAAQRLWIQYRDANSGSRKAVASRNVGAHRHVRVIGCLREGTANGTVQGNVPHAGIAREI